MRRLVLIGAIILVSLALALGGALLYLNSSLGKRHILRLVNEKALAEAGLRIGWADGRGSLLYNYVVVDPWLVTTGGDTILTASTIRIRVRPRSALEGDLELTRVEIDRPVVDVMALPKRGERARAEAVGTDSTGAAPGPGDARARARAIRVDNLVLRNGRVRWSRPGTVSGVSNATLRGAITLGGISVAFVEGGNCD